jgi:hypothetical protein
MDVHKQWKKKEILKKALNYSAEESDFKDMLSDDGIRLLHSGYSWWTKTSWNATLYEAHYQNGTVPKEMNMHKVSLDKPTHHMEEDAIDCRKMGRVYYDYYEAFFNNDGNYRWTIRHATGKELAAAGTAYDKQGKIQGVEDVYRYYRDVEPTADGAYATTDPEETTADVPANRVKVGHLIGKNGKFYRSYDAAQEDGNGAAAMVVYLGGDKCVEKDKDWNGLAIALEDAKNNDETQFAYKTGGKDDKSCSTTIEDEEHIASRHDGWAMTKRMKEKACGKDHSHPAVEVVGAMEQIPGCSEWFIPATGQWDMAIQAMGFGEYTDNHGYWGYHEEGRWLWEDAGVEGADLKASSSIREENSLYMTTTLWAVGTFEYYVFQNEPLNSVLDYVTKRMSDKSFVRPFLAFKVGNGGSINPEEPEE